MMNAIEGAVPTPQVQIVVHSRAGRQIFRDCPPLTSRTQNIHEPVDDCPHVHMAPIATTFSWRDQRPHMRPFLVGQIAGITQQASVVTPAILVRPHRRPPESGRSLESQTVPMNQIVLGRALRKMRLAFDAACKHLSNEVAESETWRLNLARRVFLHVEHGEGDPCTLAFLAAEDLRMQHPLLPGLKPAHTAKASV